MRIAVIGHAEHVTLGRAKTLPAAGDILHIDDPAVIAGGGGGVAFFQLSRGDAELHFFTALGRDDAAHEVHHQIAETKATIHAALRNAPHTRDLVIVTPGERTIFVIGQPLQPQRDDRLSWDLLATCDAVYFTGEDPATIEAARAAKTLVVTARRAESLGRSGVRADVVLGSALDPREAAHLRDFAVPPRAVVMTEGAKGGTVETSSGTQRFAAAPPPKEIVGAYGAGDSFAGALTWYVARGLSIVDACERASHYGAAVLGGWNPLDHQLPLT